MDCCNHQCEACHKHKERTPEEMKALINRLNRIEGQVRGIRGMVVNLVKLKKIYGKNRRCRFTLKQKRRNSLDLYLWYR